MYSYITVIKVIDNYLLILKHDYWYKWYIVQYNVFWCPVYNNHTLWLSPFIFREIALSMVIELDKFVWFIEIEYESLLHEPPLSTKWSETTEGRISRRTFWKTKNIHRWKTKQSRITTLRRYTNTKIHFPSFFLLYIKR